MTQAGLLRLMQVLSPAFPVGSYAYSQGLEWAIAQEQVRDAASLAAWLDASLRHGAAHTDAILLALGLRAETDLAQLALQAEALAAGRERHAETMEQGRAFAAANSALTGADCPALPYPVAVAAAARPLGLPAPQVIALFLQATLANLVQVAVRFVPLGQSDGQRVIAALAPAIDFVAAEVVEAPFAALGTAALGADLASLLHETMDVRIFRT